MLDPYRRILTLPGALAFSATGLLARLPISMLGLGIILVVSARTGSYGYAGGVSAASVVAAAVGSPLQGRLTDRFGQFRVLPATSVVFATGVALLVVAIESGWADPLSHLFAALAGFSMPQIGSMVRARWSHAIEDRTMVQTAFALEAVVDEVVFIVGPVLVAVLATLSDPYLGLVCAGVFGLVGGLLLARQRRTEPVVAARPGGESGHEPLGWVRLLPLLAAGVGLGSMFGASEVVAVAVASAEGHRGAAGGMLAAWAAGSLAAGVLVGAVRSRWTPLAQFRVSATALTATVVPMPFLDSLVLLTVALFVSGLAISPTLVSTISLVEQYVPRTRLTEGISWATTGIATGVAPGAAISGWVVDTYGASSGWFVLIASGALATALAWGMRRAPD